VLAVGVQHRFERVLQEVRRGGDEQQPGNAFSTAGRNVHRDPGTHR